MPSIHSLSGKGARGTADIVSRLSTTGIFSPKRGCNGSISVRVTAQEPALVAQVAPCGDSVITLK